MTEAQAKSDRPPETEGTKIAQYVLRSRLGEGGMGIVWKAEDGKLRRTVALKLLRTRIAGDPDRRRRFLREGRLAAHLTHPCIATVYEVGEADGRVFIAMEYVEGDSLTSFINPEKPLSHVHVMHVAREVTRGLRRAHEIGIIHRDLKPDNVIVGRDGIVKILDFGIAKPLEHFDVEFTDIHTQHGSLVGTPAYMSPEQAAGKDTIDARSDIFSLGVLMYQVLTGVRPFDGETWQEIIIAINRDTVEPVCSRRPDVPVDVERIIMRCLAKSPAERYQACSELLTDIDYVLMGSAAATVTGQFPKVATPLTTSSTLRPPPPADTGIATLIPSQPPPRAKPRRRLLFAALGGAVAVAATVSIVAVGVGGGGPATAETQPVPAPSSAPAAAASSAPPAASSSPAMPEPEPAPAASATAAAASASAAPSASASAAAKSKGPAPPPPAPTPRPKNPVLGF